MIGDPRGAAPKNLRILYVATKPAFPPNDGGRLLMWNSLVAMAARGHHITFVAPTLGQAAPRVEAALAAHCSEVHLVAARPGGLALSMVRSTMSRRPLSVVRHTHANLRRRLVELLELRHYDVIHAEQIHAVANLPTSNGIPPVVLRAQNVESRLWRMLAGVRPRIAWIARREARKMAAYEAATIARAAATIVLTRDDAAIFGGGMNPSARGVRVVPPPFPARLEVSSRPLEGNPALIAMTSGWVPNRDSIRWLLDSVWGAVVRRNPSAHLHVFGDGEARESPATSWHLSPRDSADIFHEGAILVVPLRIASGIRMKIIEAWARGVPVVATPEAARGLDGADGREFLLARDGQEFAEAIQRLHHEPGLRQTLIEGGHAALAARHDPATVAGMIEASYRESRLPEERADRG
jgi:glycosyltransferase involved in cell wall biosynthesis